MFKRLYYYFKYHNIYYDVKYGIKNLIRYFVLIWCDRDWDYVYLLRMLHKKLSFMRDAFEDDEYHYTEKNVKDMNICIKLLERLMEDDYFNETNLTKKYPEYKKYMENFCLDYRKHIPKEKLDDFNKDFKFEINKEEELKKQDLEMLFNLLRKHLRSWWI